MADQPHAPPLFIVDSERIEQGGQDIARLMRHEIDGPLHVVRTWRRLPIPGPRIDEPAHAEPIAKLPWPISPHRERAEPLVQE
jgi:hypothetical protein